MVPLVLGWRLQELYYPVRNAVFIILKYMYIYYILAKTTLITLFMETALLVRGESTAVLVLPSAIVSMEVDVSLTCINETIIIYYNTHTCTHTHHYVHTYTGTHVYTHTHKPKPRCSKKCSWLITVLAPFPQSPASSQRKFTCLGIASQHTSNTAHFLGVRK